MNGESGFRRRHSFIICRGLGQERENKMDAKEAAEEIGAQ